LSAYCAQVPDRAPGGNVRCGGNDSIGVDAKMAVKILNCAGLTEMLNAKGRDSMAAYAAQPGECGRMPIDNAYQSRVPGNSRKEPFDMTYGIPAATHPLARCGMPSSIEAIGGRHGKEADVAPVFANAPRSLNRFRRNAALIDDDRVGVRSRLPPPIGPVNDGLAEIRICSK
jgi:hypothetical protein